MGNGRRSTHKMGTEANGATARPTLFRIQQNIFWPASLQWSHFSEYLFLETEICFCDIVRELMYHGNI